MQLALSSLICADVPLRNYSLTHCSIYLWQDAQSPTLNLNNNAFQSEAEHRWIQDTVMLLCSATYTGSAAQHPTESSCTSHCVHKRGCYTEVLMWIVHNSATAMIHLLQFTKLATYRHAFLLMWPWTWPNDLDICTWHKDSVDVSAYQKWTF